jgi:hypothetical protein
MVATFGVILEILDDGLQDFIVRPPTAVEYLELVLQNQKQLFDVLMLFEKDINDLRHRRILDQSPPEKAMIAAFAIAVLATDAFPALVKA